MNPALLQSQSTSEPSVWFVCLLGVGVVFFGLVLLVIIVSLMNLITSRSSKKTTQTAEQENTVEKNDTVIENKQEILAAVCAAVAEENGTDISAIRVLSFKKVN